MARERRRAMDAEEHWTALTQPGRLRALRRTELLDSLPEPSFDRFTRLAARLTGAPVALVSLVDDQRQYFKSFLGLGEPWATRRGTPLSHSFCQYVAASGQPLVVEDARTHEQVKDNGAIADLGVIAYLGTPLWADGKCIGSLCVVEGQPRQWSEEDKRALQDLAATVNAEIELRLTTHFTERLSQLVPSLIYLYDHAQRRLSFFNEQAAGYDLNPLFNQATDGEVCLMDKSGNQRWFFHRSEKLDLDKNLQLGVATDVQQCKREVLAILAKQLAENKDLKATLERLTQGLEGSAEGATAGE